MNIKDDLLSFHRDGFLLIKNVFSATEVAQLRARAEAFGDRARELGQIFEPRAGEVVPAADLTAPFGGEILFDARIQEIVHTLLGRKADEDVVYFGDSGMMLGGHGRGFHKDNACRDDASHTDWLTPYTLIRLGIYLEDHKAHSGGVKVRRGSHLVADVSTGEIVDVPTEAGDVVVWSLRTTHSGHALRLKGLPFLHIQPRFEQRLPRSLAVDEPCRRVALFMTFGLDDHHLKTYVDKHADLESYPDNYLYKIWLHSDPDPKLAELAKSRGCRIIHPVPDYGKLFASTEQVAGGFIATGPGTPDRYPAKGAEVLIQGMGKIVRRVFPSAAH